MRRSPASSVSFYLQGSNWIRVYLMATVVMADDPSKKAQSLLFRFAILTVILIRNLYSLSCHSYPDVAGMNRREPAHQHQNEIAITTL